MIKTITLYSNLKINIKIVLRPEVLISQLERQNNYWKVDNFNIRQKNPWIQSHDTRAAIEAGIWCLKNAREGLNAECQQSADKVSRSEWLWAEAVKNTADNIYIRKKKTKTKSKKLSLPNVDRVKQTRSILLGLKSTGGVRNELNNNKYKIVSL